MFTVTKIFHCFLKLLGVASPLCKLASELFFTCTIFYLVKGGFHFNFTFLVILPCMNHEIVFVNFADICRFLMPHVSL